MLSVHRQPRKQELPLSHDPNFVSEIPLLLTALIVQQQARMLEGGCCGLQISAVM